MNPRDFLYGSCIIKCYVQVSNQGRKCLVFLNPIFSMLYMMMKHIFMISFWNLSNTRSTQKRKSLALSDLSVLSRAKSKSEIHFKRERLVQKTT